MEIRFDISTGAPRLWTLNTWWTKRNSPFVYPSLRGNDGLLVGPLRRQRTYSKERMCTYMNVQCNTCYVWKYAVWKSRVKNDSHPAFALAPKAEETTCLCKVQAPDKHLVYCTVVQVVHSCEIRLSVEKKKPSCLGLSPSFVHSLTVTRKKIQITRTSNCNSRWRVIFTEKTRLHFLFFFRNCLVLMGLKFWTFNWTFFTDDFVNYRNY